MRKKLTGILALLACILVLSACGAGTSPDVEEIPEELQLQLYSLAENTAQQMDAVVAQGLADEQSSNKVVYTGLQGWASAADEIGQVDFVTDANSDGIADCFERKSITRDSEGDYVVTVRVQGAVRNANLVVTFKNDLSEYVSIATNINYTKKELIQQAGLNTLLGMGTTFCVLILLSLIIAAFGKVLTSSSKKKDLEKDVQEMPVRKEDARPAAAPSGGRGSAAQDVDDGALVAVITAAIAAYRASNEPAADPDAFVVRKIRRIRRK